jgi:hypothetical protein
MTSIIKVNNLQNQCGANTINKCGTAITVGASGDTVTLAAGASQSGFGQTYSAVSWDTTPKTTTVTGVAGVGYFVNTSGGAITANLPAGTAGDVIAFADYTRTFQTNNLTITPNGAEKIGGVAASFYAQTEGQSVTLVYVDATEGWINTMDSTGQAGLLPAFITATGGTITTVCTDYKVHTFTGPGTFTVCSVGNPLGSDTVDYMVVAGGGGGGSWAGGGAGAGGFRESSGTASGSYSASPLGACVSALPVTVTGFPITVGAGGSVASCYANRENASNGSNSIFSTITSQGGGKGGNDVNPSQPTEDGNSGGSGGGGRSGGGAGNTPPVSPPQGNTGGAGHSCGSNYFGGGGGGAGAVGSSDPGGNDAGPGGAGVTSSINATPTTRAGGGGGGNVGTGSSTGGAGGGGAGGNGGGPNPGTAGTTNTGGGGGATGATNTSGVTAGVGGAGGSGIVIIRYKFQ